MANTFLCNCYGSPNITQDIFPRTTCGDASCGKSCEEATQKRILNQVRVSESQFIDVKKAFYIGNERLSHSSAGIISRPKMSNMSDRNVSEAGVDVKHGSYTRYLGKLKARHLILTKEVNTPLIGNKTRNFSLINTSCKC